MQSSNYVPGVSGWKIDPASGAFEMASDRVAVVGTDPKAIYSGKSQPKEPKPFVVVDGATYISQAEVVRVSVAAHKIGGHYSVKLRTTEDGKVYMAGMASPLISQFIVSADRFAITPPTEFEEAPARGAGAVMDLLAGKICDTQLGADLKSGRITAIADQVRDVIRSEMRPGGLLHRN
ncbi:DUF1983 domain-containing protein [Pseudomonas brassicacearum]|uniref:Tip attachment protein J central straight fiber domain-containing protein n=1 Tax=Pseudomonas brassicacearum TaxID=930166 RepID=A0A423H089_9PSED|nr:DUF1983 domain-containing protein [Pseudomonas brassicacearum]RON05148.1 hypothetical protein BK658_02270 [Pseudomonas brassicacearum]